MSTSGRDGLAATDALIDNVLNTRFDDIEPEVVENAKKRILDMIGNMIGGTRCAGNPELADLVRGWGGRREATMTGFGSKGPAHDLAMLNAIFGRSFDRGPLTLIIDGDGKPGTIYVDGKPIRRFANHITETTIPVALAMIRDPKLQALVGRVKLDDLDKPEGVELRMKLKDGRELSEYVDRATGEPYTPLSREGLIAKFMEQVEFSQTVATKDAEKIVKLVEELERVDDVSKVTELAAQRQ